MQTKEIAQIETSYCLMDIRLLTIARIMFLRLIMRVIPKLLIREVGVLLISFATVGIWVTNTRGKN